MTVESAPPATTRLPRWAIVLLVAAGAFVLTVVGLVVGFIVAVIAEPALGITESSAVRPGSCLAETEPDLASYTVVDCAEAHPQQVIAEIDLGRNTAQYTTASALSSYADEICARFLEYGLFVTDAVDERFTVVALAVPSPEAAAAGSTAARCSLTSADGSALSESYYRAMP